MREISIIDMQMVSGGDVSIGDAIAAGTALGGGIGVGIAQSLGLSASAGLALAGYASIAGGAVTTAGILGYLAGQALNSNTPIQEWISDIIDKMTSADGDE